MMPHVFELFIAGTFGAIFGSFASFVGFRLFNDNKNINILGKRSICCNCHHTLSILDLIPIFSFLFLHGKCRYCHQSIPCWHFLAELYTTTSFVIAVQFFNGFNTQSILMCIICTCLAIQSIIDKRVMMSSDIIHLITFICCYLLSKNLGYNHIHISTMVIFIIVFFISLSLIMQ